MSSSDSNTVVSLTRLFEMLLTEPVNEDPENKNIRTWIMASIHLQLVRNIKLVVI